MASVLVIVSARELVKIDDAPGNIDWKADVIVIRGQAFPWMAVWPVETILRVLPIMEKLRELRHKQFDAERAEYVDICKRYPLAEDAEEGLVFNLSSGLWDVVPRNHKGIRVLASTRASKTILARLVKLHAENTTLAEHEAQKEFSLLREVSGRTAK